MVKERFRKGKSISEGEAPEDLAGCVREAADLCPVQIIRIED
jgi:ferredoxin